MKAMASRLTGLTGKAKEFYARTMASGAQAPLGTLGVDIGTYAVKVVRLDSGKEGARVMGYGIEKIADKNVREAISRALAKAKASPDQAAAISVSGQGVVSRYVEMPMMSRGDLESSMKFEIEKYVPFALTDVATDFTVIHEMKDKAKMSVLVAAAKNDIVGKKMNLAKELNLNLKVLDLDCLALANFFTEFGSAKKGSCAAIINLGKTVSNIDVMVDGVPHLSRDIFMGGDDVTKKTAEVLELDYNDAERLKCDPEARRKELTAVWDQVLSHLAAEIRVSFDYFEARMNRTVEALFMTGGMSRLAGLEDYFHHILGVETKKLDFADRLLSDELIDRSTLKRDADFLAIALGLALR